MDIEQMLEAEHSKKQTIIITQYIGSDQKKFDELLQIFIKGPYRITQRAAWPLSFIAIAYPWLIEKYYDLLLHKLNDEKQHEGVRRNIMRIFAAMKSYPEKHHGLLMDCCLRFIESVNTKVAVQAHALKILSNLSVSYPEIIPEIKMIIEERVAGATAAYVSASNQFLKATKKIN